jgi:polyhydroxyalkanoate synthesis regulator phasin
MPKPTEPPGIGSVFSKLWDKIKALFSAILAADNNISTQTTNIIEFVFTIQDTIEKAEQQWKDFKNWEFDWAQWKTRVISIPETQRAFEELKDKVIETFTVKLKRVSDEAKQLVADLKSQDHPEPTGGAEGDAGALANTIVKIENVISKLNHVATFVNDLLDFTQQIDDIKTQIQNLDGFFLSQASPRKTVTDRYRKRKG